MQLDGPVITSISAHRVGYTGRNSTTYCVDSETLTRNLAIASRSRSASGEYNSRNNCSHMASDRCTFVHLCRCCIFDMHTIKPFIFIAPEMTLKVDKGHWRWHSLIGHLSFHSCSMRTGWPKLIYPAVNWRYLGNGIKFYDEIYKMNFQLTSQ